MITVNDLIEVLVGLREEKNCGESAVMISARIGAKLNVEAFAIDKVDFIGSASFPQASEVNFRLVEKRHAQHQNPLPFLPLGRKRVA